MHVSGALPAGDLSKATEVLYSALNVRYNARMSTAAGENLSKTADAICGSDRNNTIATGNASAQTHHSGFGSRAQYTFVLQVYTCFGAKLAEGTASAGTISEAVQRAVDEYASAHPSNG